MHRMSAKAEAAARWAGEDVYRRVIVVVDSPDLEYLHLLPAKSVLVP